jgi:hypothetical protein
LGLRLTDDVLLHLVFFFCSKHCCKSFWCDQIQNAKYDYWCKWKGFL